MRHRAFPTALFAACTLFVVTATASAHTYVWLGGYSPGWSDSRNWISLTGNHYPGHNSNDIAIVTAPLAFHPFLNQDIAVDGLTIGNGAAVTTFGHDLEIAGSSSLVIYPSGDLYVSDGDALIFSGATKAEVGGEIVLLGDNTSLRFESDIDLCGFGNVRGVISSDAPDTRILFANGVSVASSLVFGGSMQFRAVNVSGTPATFTNRGLVVAFDVGRIDLLPSVKLLDSNGDTRWRTQGSILVFHRSSNDSDADHPILVGDVDIVDCGEVWIADGAEVVTNGVFEHFSGTVRILNGGFAVIDSLLFTDDYTSSDCNE